MMEQKASQELKEVIDKEYDTSKIDILKERDKNIINNDKIRYSLGTCYEDMIEILKLTRAEEKVTRSEQ